MPEPRSARLLLLLRLRLRRLDLFCPICLLLPGSMTLTTVFTGSPSAKKLREAASERALAFVEIR